MSFKGKMKDSYPLEKFFMVNILRAIDKNQWSFILYSILFNKPIYSIIPY